MREVVSYLFLANNRMEEDIYEYEFKSDLLAKSSIQKQIEDLKAAVAEADEIIKYEAAHNPEIQYAIDIVGAFLRKKGRVCYGGTAINMILPRNLRFYDPQKDLPDYDFFTPNPEKDIKDIVKDLQQAGFPDVVERVGMHEGTHKILVNFVPIADISTLDPELYKILAKRSIEKEGIHYADPDFLRMMMYLELSRPRGDVSRWAKVYERLLLLNEAFPPKVCRVKTKHLVSRVSLPIAIRKPLLEYVIDNERVLMGAEVVAMYDWLIFKKKRKTPSFSWFLKKEGMIVFLSPEAERDANRLKEIFATDEITVEKLEAKGELVPERAIVRYRGMPFVEILQEVACHSFTSLKLSDNRNLRVASLETLLTFYYALTLFTDDEEILQFYMTCLTQKLVEMDEILHQLGGVGPIPSFSIECSGYQKGYATLLKEKFARIAKAKQKQKFQSMRHKRKTNRTTRRLSK